MNRLVIVGNGFDLAHGLKTRYEDFLLDLFKKALQESATTPGYEYDKRLFKITCYYPNDFYTNVQSLKSLFDGVNINNPKSRSPIITRSEPRRPYHISFQSWFSELITENNWVDIESAYFKELTKQTLDQDKYNPKYIENFNASFNYLTEKLRVYMEDVNHKLEGLQEFPKLQVIKNCFKPVSDENFEHFFANTPDKNQLSKVVFLNFNYTKLLELYLKETDMPYPMEYGVLNIHGPLRNEKDIIFGYGDDTHPKYKELELLDDNEVLSKMKSFQYPTNKSYRHLINFIESDYFDVVVMGHSLGISDRVLLKTIFEIDFCKMITILHRSENKNDFKKWIPLSRHFDNKVKMRRKIKDFEDEDIM